MGLSGSLSSVHKDRRPKETHSMDSVHTTLRDQGELFREADEQHQQIKTMLSGEQSGHATHTCTGSAANGVSKVD